MAELATIARPYAEALFKVVVVQDLRPGTSAWLDQRWPLVAGDSQLRQFADDPKVTRRTGVPAWCRAAQRPVAGCPAFRTSCAR